MTVQIEQSTLYLIRYCALSVVLLTGLLYGTFMIFQKKVASEKDKFYERNITEIMNRGKLIGHTILLRDITEQQQHLELVQNYNSRLKAEVAEKTKHIQLVQDSIITGIASVVESRDNSTGGHINRTSAVVRILTKKLLESSKEKLTPELERNCNENYSK